MKKQSVCVGGTKIMENGKRMHATGRTIAAALAAILCALLCFALGACEKEKKTICMEIWDTRGNSYVIECAPDSTSTLTLTYQYVSVTNYFDWEKFEWVNRPDTYHYIGIKKIYYKGDDAQISVYPDLLESEERGIMFDLNVQGTSLLNYKLVNGAELKCILNITGKATPEISFDFDTENCIEYTEGERYVYKADGKVHMPRKVTMTYENRTFAVLERPIDEWGEFLEADYFGDKKTYAFARTKLIGDKWYIDGSGDYASSLPRQRGTYRMVIRVSNRSYSEKDRDLFYDMVEYPVTIVIVDE